MADSVGGRRHQCLPCRFEKKIRLLSWIPVLDIGALASHR